MQTLQIPLSRGVVAQIPLPDFHKLKRHEERKRDRFLQRLKALFTNKKAA